MKQHYYQDGHALCDHRINYGNKYEKIDCKRCLRILENLPLTLS